MKGVSLNHLYNAWNTTALHSLLGLVPSLLDLEALEKQCPLACTSILRFSPLEIDLPFGSSQKSPWSYIFKSTTSEKPAKPLPSSVMDFQQKTQWSGWEKTKCEYIVSTFNYSTGIGWKWGRRRRASLFIYKILTVPPKAASVWTLNRGPASTRTNITTSAPCPRKRRSKWTRAYRDLHPCRRDFCRWHGW